MSAAFARDTGIEAEFVTGVFAEVFARETREARSGNVTIDVSVSGASEFPLMREGLRGR